MLVWKGDLSTRRCTLMVVLRGELHRVLPQRYMTDPIKMPHPILQNPLELSFPTVYGRHPTPVVDSTLTPTPTPTPQAPAGGGLPFALCSRQREMGPCTRIMCIHGRALGDGRNQQRQDQVWDSPRSSFLRRMDVDVDVGLEGLAFLTLPSKTRLKECPVPSVIKYPSHPSMDPGHGCSDINKGPRLVIPRRSFAFALSAVPA